jgi:putative ABC transport system permease protein
MTRVALKGLARRKLRALLTALAIVLGVAMISGSLVLTDTISEAFHEIFTGAYAHTDAVVSGRSLVTDSNGGAATVSARTLARIQALPDVAAASGAVADLNGESTQARLIGRDGKAIQANGNPTFGFGVDPSQPRFNPLHLVDGRWARGSHEVVIDAETAHAHGFRVGEPIGVAAQGPVRQFRIVGLARYGDVSSLGGATIAVFPVAEAQRLLQIHGYTGVSVAARPGVSVPQLVRELRTAVPANELVRTAAQQARSDEHDVAGFVTFIRGFLLAFGGIALLVGAFVIFNTLSITVAQRTRELATLRTLGASRRQVLRSVFLEATALGALASAVGLGVGFALARGLSAVFGALGLSLPEASTIYATHTFVAAFAVGIGVTIAAGIAPAVRATRVPPIAAVREGAVVVGRRRRLGPAAAGVVLAAAAALIGWAVVGGHIGSGSHLLALAGGTLLALAGMAALAPALVAVLASVVGIPARRLGGAAGSLAAENAVRNPARTASTAAALMIGLALVSFVAVLAKGVHGSYDRGVRQQLAADWVVTSNDGWSAFPRAAGEAIARTPGVLATSIRSDSGRVGTAEVTVNGVDPRTIGALYRFGWRDGSAATLGRLDRGGALVKQSFASKHHLAAGDRFTLRTPAGVPLRLVVAGTFQPPRVAELLGGVVVSQRAFDSVFAHPGDALTLVRGGTQAALARTLAPFPDAKLYDEAGYVKASGSFVDSLLNVVYVLLALSVLVSVFGMVNTLVLSVFERTRELGMLRAVGMTRRQARRMVRHESVITSLIGAALGLPLGILLAAAVTHALTRYSVTFALPVGSLAVFAVVAAVAGILAAIAPARRASRLNVLAALQYE